ncbi:MAG: hypothetical protein JW795_06270, partial [Chitinivibrionales bacterium]|nr:hypothetical protein [Chitinivibrionales bacterium]
TGWISHPISTVDDYIPLKKTDIIITKTETGHMIREVSGNKQRTFQVGSNSAMLELLSRSSKRGNLNPTEVSIIFENYEENEVRGLISSVQLKSNEFQGGNGGIGNGFSFFRSKNGHNARDIQFLLDARSKIKYAWDKSTIKTLEPSIVKSGSRTGMTKCGFEVTVPSINSTIPFHIRIITFFKNAISQEKLTMIRETIVNIFKRHTSRDNFLESIERIKFDLRNELKINDIEIEIKENTGDVIITWNGYQKLFIPAHKST